MDSLHLESEYPATSRAKEIREILRFVEEGNSCQIIAPPGVGRGNILGFLAYNRAIKQYHLGKKQDFYHFVLVNFSEVKNRPLIDIMKFLFLELVSSLHERGLDEEFKIADKIFKDSLTYQDELVLFQGFKKTIDYLSLEKKLTIVLLFERFETYIPRLSEEFFTYMRSLRNRAKYKFSIIFSLTRPLEEMVEPFILADFYEFLAGHIVYLDLCDMPGILFRIHHLERLTKKKIEKVCIDTLLQLTAGQGKLTRVSMEAILGNTKDPTSCASSEFLLSQKTVQGALFEMWYFLTPSEKDYMSSILLGRNHQEPALFLEKIGIVKDGVITIPLFASFIKEYALKEFKQENKIIFDITTNTIRRGTTVISEKLTSAEFRLLLFLIQNKEKVLDRETIISAVWRNQESTRGVTDQALDQLIFRLRKQIEPNPNKPILIQTIKGRGLKFSDESPV